MLELYQNGNSLSSIIIVKMKVTYQVSDLKFVVAIRIFIGALAISESDFLNIKNVYACKENILSK